MIEYRLGLIGYPLGHSLSSLIHTAALNHLGWVGEYIHYSISPTKEGEEEIGALLDQVRRGGIHGLNVTIPHKQTIIQFLDQMTPAAKAIGAVNTIYMNDGKLMGDTTDPGGFLFDLRRVFAGTDIFEESFIGEIDPNNRTSGVNGNPGKKALVLGAGGSARAVVWALMNAGFAVLVCSRRLEQADALCTDLLKSVGNGHLLSTVPYSEEGLRQASEAGFDLLVNATPIGMTPNVPDNPWFEDIPLPVRVCVYDLVYNPRQTKLVEWATSQGHVSSSGLGMLIAQAALSFEIWTGVSGMDEIMRTVVEK